MYIVQKYKYSVMIATKLMPMGGERAVIDTGNLVLLRCLFFHFAIAHWLPPYNLLISIVKMLNEIFGKGRKFFLSRDSSSI